jgi:hypothetical protein
MNRLTSSLAIRRNCAIYLVYNIISSNVFIKFCDDKFFQFVTSGVIGVGDNPNNVLGI